MVVVTLFRRNRFRLRKGGCLLDVFHCDEIGRMSSNITGTNGAQFHMELYYWLLVFGTCFLKNNFEGPIQSFKHVQAEVKV